MRSGQVKNVQKDILIEFIKSHHDLQTGKFTASFTKQIAQTLWEEVTVSLNAVPAAPQKTWMQWRKTWQDLKKNAKAKTAVIRQHAMGTGGGSPCNIKLTESDLEIVNDIIVPTVIEGNQSIMESTCAFQFEDLQEDDLQEPEPQTLDLLQDQTVVSQAAGSSKVLDSEESEVLDFGRSAQTSKSTINKEARIGNPTPSRKRLLNSPETATRMTKVKRLEKSLTLTKELVTVSKEKKVALENYYEEKLKLLRIKLERDNKYHEEKLNILKERNMIHSEILHTLKNIENGLS